MQRSPSLPGDRCTPPPTNGRWHEGAAWTVLAILLLSNLPLFVCMPLTADTALYDLQADSLIQGGTQYRDIFETNLPGVVWLHVAIRSLAGRSSEAMRIVDGLIFASIVLLLAKVVGLMGQSRTRQVWTAVFVVWCYLSASEWCHCQRDVWLLLPGLVGLGMRRWQIERIERGDATLRQLAAWGFAEGVCWGLGVWLKPFLVVPALCCWLIGVVYARRGKAITADLCGLLAGGSLVGAAGIHWMMATDTWPYFLQTFIEWNPEYVAARARSWTATRFTFMVVRLFPWYLLHAAAIPLAVSCLVRGLGVGRAGQEAGASPKRLDPSHPAIQPGTALFSAFYLGWLLQAFFLQHLFDYIHLPGVLLAIALIAGQWPAFERSVAWKWAAVGFSVVALLVSPVAQPGRLACWSACLREGSTPDVRDRLSSGRFPNWQEMQPVVEFLQSQNVCDGEVTCYNVHLVHLYCEMGLEPSTPFVGLEALIRLFPSHEPDIRHALMHSHQRFVVTELVESGMSEQEALAVGPEGPLVPPPAYPRGMMGTFPWSQPVVFRSGRYLVHQVQLPVGDLGSRLTLQSMADAQRDEPPILADHSGDNR